MVSNACKEACSAQYQIAIDPLPKYTLRLRVPLPERAEHFCGNDMRGQRVSNRHMSPPLYEDNARKLLSP